MYRQIFTSGLLLALGIVSTNAASQSAIPIDEIYINCKSSDNAFMAVISGNNGPIAVYKDKKLWHTFPAHQKTSQSYSSTNLVKLDGFKKRFRNITLDRLTGTGKIVDWTDEQKLSFSKGATTKQKVKLKIEGECEKVDSPVVDRKF